MCVEYALKGNATSIEFCFLFLFCSWHTPAWDCNSGWGENCSHIVFSIILFFSSYHCHSSSFSLLPPPSVVYFVTLLLCCTLKRCVFLFIDILHCKRYLSNYHIHFLSQTMLTIIYASLYIYIYIRYKVTRRRRQEKRTKCMFNA